MKEKQRYLFNIDKVEIRNRTSIREREEILKISI